MYISFSGYKVFTECPKQYWHQYVDKTRPPKPDNMVNSLYGSTIGVIFEIFYRDKVWRSRDYEAHLQTLVEPTLSQVIIDQKRSIVDWEDEKANYHTREALVQDVRDSIPRGLNLIRENGFLGLRAEAEAKLDHKFGPHTMGGRADFIIHREKYNDCVLLDGKGSKHREKYIKNTQLYWYALLYQAKTGTLPDKLGFVYWRFEGEQGVGWVDMQPSDLKDLKAEVLGTLDRLDTGIRRLESLAFSPKSSDETRQEYFPAQPSFGCNLCSYLSLCEEGSKKFGAKKSEYTPKSKVKLPGAGVRDLDLDDEE